MSELPAILAANEQFAATFDEGHLVAPPTRRLVVLTCMDARMDISRILGLSIGDSHVLRNAGGRASSDAIRSLVISTHLLDTREIIIMHHTECGMAAITNQSIYTRIRDDVGFDASEVDFLPLLDPEQNLRDDVAAIRESPLFLPDLIVHGLIYDVRTGRLRQIV